MAFFRPDTIQQTLGAPSGAQMSNPATYRALADRMAPAAGFAGGGYLQSNALGSGAFDPRSGNDVVRQMYADDPFASFPRFFEAA